MGSSSSKTSSTSTSNQKYETNIVNKSDTEILNKTVNDFSANTVVKKASDCSANITQLQTVDFSNMKITGDLKIGEIDQTQSAALTFDCVQIDTFKNDIANGTMTSYMDALKNNYNSDTLDKMNATAGASAKGSFGSTGQTNTKSNSNVDYKFNSTTDTHTNIQNVVQNAIQNNLSMETLKNCIAHVKSNQLTTASGTSVGGSVDIQIIKQDQASTAMADCTQKSDDGNKITNEIAQELGITIDNSNSVKKTTNITTSATAESVSTGVGEAVSSVFTSFFTGIGNMFGGIFGIGTTMSPYIGSCVVVCLICCLLSIVVYTFKMMMGGGDSANYSTDNGPVGDDDNGVQTAGGLGSMLYSYNCTRSEMDLSHLAKILTKIKSK
jgi:hypothetical protein